MPNLLLHRHPFARTFLVWGVSFLVVWFLFGPALIDPGAYTFSLYHDGAKNFFTFEWYLQTDRGLRFTGMNYPYGEHLVFTDNQPALVLLLKPLVAWIGAENINLLALHNGILIWASLATVPLLTAIGRKLGLTFGLALLAATITTLLSPQFARLNGHFAMAWPAFLPALWLLQLIRFEKPHAWWPGALFATLLFFGSFLHLYLGAIGGAFLITDTLIRQWPKPLQKRKPWWQLAKKLVWIMLPFIAVVLIIKLTDPITDRPERPWDAYIERLRLTQLLFNEASLFRPPAGYPIVGEAGRSYTGVAGSIAMIGFLIAGAYLLVRKRLRAVIGLGQPGMRSAVVASLVLLVYAMALPKGLGFGMIYDWFPLVKQFRATERFAWVFVMVFPMLVALRLQAWMRLRPYRFILAVIAALWLFDAAMVATQRTSDIFNSTEHMDRAEIEQHLKTTGHAVHDFQAILPLPFYHVGSETLILQPIEPGHAKSMRFASASGLPLVSVNLSRTSWAQSQAIIQLASHPQIPKPWLQALPDARPLLLLVSGELQAAHDRRLLAKGHFLCSMDDLSIYSLPLDSLVQEKPPSPLLAPAYFDPLRSEKEAFTEVSHHQSLTSWVCPSDGEWTTSLWCQPAPTQLNYVAPFGIEVRGDITEHFHLEGKHSADVMNGWIRIETTVRMHTGDILIWKAPKEATRVRNIWISKKGTVTGISTDTLQIINNFPSTWTP